MPVIDGRARVLYIGSKLGNETVDDVEELLLCDNDGDEIQVLAGKAKVRDLSIGDVLVLIDHAAGADATVRLLRKIAHEIEDRGIEISESMIVYTKHPGFEHVQHLKALCDGIEANESSQVN